MNTIINRILELEKQSAMEIEQAENTYKKNIDALLVALEEKKEQVQELIITKENARLTQAIQEFNKKSGDESLAALKDYETLFQDPAKVIAIKEKIASILLTE